MHVADDVSEITASRLLDPVQESKAFLAGQIEHLMKEVGHLARGRLGELHLGQAQFAPSMPTGSSTVASAFAIARLPFCQLKN